MGALTAPVLIVGAGPVGLVLASELSHHGVPCLLAERSLMTTEFPKMDITNARSMELLARLGLADDVRAVGVAPEHSFDVVFIDGLDESSTELGRWRLPSVDDARRMFRHVNDGTQPREPAQRCSQALFEALVMARCEADPLIEVRRGWRCESVEELGSGGGVTHLVDDTTGDPVDVRADWVVGCDGASSAVRRSLGIELEGITGMAHLAMVHFRSRDVRRLHRFGRFWHLYFTNGAVIISQDERDTWTMHQLVDGDFDWEGRDPVAFVQEQVGVPIEIDEVLLTSRWSPNLLVAERYREGRVFLAGDSCHQVIPTGGYGMNTGVGDAVDLGWKLAAVFHGWGGPTLLDSYDLERRPVAVQNRDRSGRHAFALLEWRSKVAAGDVCGAEPGENESFGIELDYRFPGSPVVTPSDPADGPEPAWDPLVITPSTRPGHRAPSAFCADGSALHDRFSSTGFTLVDFARDGRHEPLVRAAVERGFPLVVTQVDDPLVALLYERALVLVRPDGFVAWRGDHVPPDPEACRALIDRLRGA